MDYIVYEVHYKNATGKTEIVYIGSGKRGRESHATSGKSHSYELNELFFKEPNTLSVIIIRDNLTKQESLIMEKEYIQATEPKFNKALTSRNRKVHKHRRFLDN